MKTIPQSSVAMVQPEQVKYYWFDKETGKLASPGAANSMFEIYRTENAPVEKSIKARPDTSDTDSEALSPEDIY